MIKVMKNCLSDQHIAKKCDTTYKLFDLALALKGNFNNVLTSMLIPIMTP